ncbi:MAG: hypothetical protein MZV64_15665 [Ignavibacteriales bacterium]|nr:hypothetical protein [Ignavibacteriales bacterium]
MTDIVPLINKVKQTMGFLMSKKPDNQLKEEIFFCYLIGKGKSKVFLWSQMHGDEATATMALVRCFQFFPCE